MADDDLNLTTGQIKVYQDNLFDIEVYPPKSWSKYFNKATLSERLIASSKIFAAFNMREDISPILCPLVSLAFSYKGKEIEKAKHEAAIKILAAPDITLLQPEIVVAAFNQKGYDADTKTEIEKAKHEAAIKILKDYDWDGKKDIFMFQALRFFSTEATYPNEVNELVTKIINQFHEHKYEKGSGIYYLRLNIILGYPFHNIPLWKGNCLDYITDWRNKRTINFFVKALHSFRSHPDEIKAVCEQILKNWKREVTFEIRQIYGEAHHGDHIKIALGHPDLREIAMIAAKEMVAEEEINTNTLPFYLLEIVLKIIQPKPEFPEWNKNTENESDTQQPE